MHPVQVWEVHTFGAIIDDVAQLASGDEMVPSHTKLKLVQSDSNFTHLKLLVVELLEDVVEVEVELLHVYNHRHVLRLEKLDLVLIMAELERLLGVRKASQFDQSEVFQRFQVLKLISKLFESDVQLL